MNSVLTGEKARLAGATTMNVRAGRKNVMEMVWVSSVTELAYRQNRAIFFACYKEEKASGGRN